MDIFTWPVAIASIASTVTIVLGIIKIISMRRKPLPILTKEGLEEIKEDIEELKDKVVELSESISIQEVITEENKKDLGHLHEHFDKLNDTFIRLLTEE